MDRYQGSFWQKVPAVSGGVKVRVAPTDAGSTGRIHVKAARPGDAEDAELEVAVCTPVDLTPRKPKR